MNRAPKGTARRRPLRESPSLATTGFQRGIVQTNRSARIVKPLTSQLMAGYGIHQLGPNPERAVVLRVHATTAKRRTTAMVRYDTRKHFARIESPGTHSHRSSPLVDTTIGVQLGCIHLCAYQALAGSRQAEPASGSAGAPTDSHFFVQNPAGRRTPKLLSSGSYREGFPRRSTGSSCPARSFPRGRSHPRSHGPRRDALRLAPGRVKCYVTRRSSRRRTVTWSRSGPRRSRGPT